MTTGEEIFAELFQDDLSEERNLIKLYQPYQVKLIHGDNKTQMMLSPWQVFTDDVYYYVQADHVVVMNTLDAFHAQMYGAAVTNAELKDIQSALSETAKLGVLTAHDINEALKATYMVLIKSGIKYAMPLPEKERVKTDFYSFLMNQYEDKLEVTH